MSPAQGFIGTPRLPIAPAFVRSVLELVVAGATGLQAKQTVTPDMREDSISQRLNEEMQSLHQGSYSDIVTWSMRPVRTVPTNPDDTFVVDFLFYANILPRNPDWYLAVEAKRLRGRGRSLAASYVKEGVIRFVTGKYSLGHDHAIMLGYVVVSSADSAVTRVKASMDLRAARTRQQTAFQADSTICTHPYTYTSEHYQAASGEAFRLVHVVVELFDTS